MGKRYDQLRYYSLRDILTSTYNRRFVGRAVYPDDAKSLDDLIKIADHNMYELKHKRSEFVV
jgi:hypothetical protein